MLTFFMIFLFGIVCIITGFLIGDYEETEKRDVVRTHQRDVVRTRPVRLTQMYNAGVEEPKPVKQKPKSMKEELDFLEDLLGLESQHKPQPQPQPKPQPKKPRVSKQKAQDYYDILKAVGFSASEAKAKTIKLLTKNPKLTEQEFLREAMKK